jgi:hypothetical protein
MNEELKSDLRIRAALLRREGEPPFDQVSWDSLHRSILARTLQEFVQVRRSLNWIDYTVRWARAAIPLAVAAILALVLLLPEREHAEEPVTLVATVSGRDALTMAVAGDVHEQEFVSTVVAADRDWLVSGVIGEQ